MKKQFFSSHFLRLPFKNNWLVLMWNLVRFDSVGIMWIIFPFEEGAFIIEDVILFIDGLEIWKSWWDFIFNEQQIAFMHKIDKIVVVFLMDRSGRLHSLVDMDHLFYHFVFYIGWSFGTVVWHYFILLLMQMVVGGSFCYLGVLFSAVHLEGGMGCKIWFINSDFFVDSVLE